MIREGDGVASLGSRRGALAFAYGACSVPALLVALPLSAGAARAIGATARGDVALWDAGGFALLDLAHNARHLQRPIEAVAPFIGVAWCAFALLPLAVLLEAFANPASPSPSTLASSSVARWPALASIASVGFAMRVAAAALGAGLTSVAPAILGANAGARASLAASVVGATVGFALVGAASLVRDVASAACVRRGDAPRAAFSSGLAALGRYRARLMMVYAASAAAQACAVGAGALGAASIGVDTVPRLIAVCAMHQAVVGALVVARAWWLREAVIAVGFASWGDATGDAET